MENKIETLRIVRIKYFKYKIYLNLFLLFTFCIYNANAQDSKFHYGAKFGIGESTIESDNFPTVKSKLMLGGGLTADYNFTEYIGLGMDFLVTSKGAKVDGNVTSYDLLGNPRTHAYQSTYHLLYAELPLLVNLKANLGGFYPKVFTGPSLNFKLGASESREYDEPQYQSDNGYSFQKLKNTATAEYSYVFGVGADVPDKSGRIYFVELKFSKPLSPIATINSMDVNSEYYGVYAGYKF